MCVPEPAVCCAVQDLETKFAESVAKKEDLAAKVEDATVKRDRAERLLGGRVT